MSKRNMTVAERPHERARRIADNPALASDADKLRTIADMMDATDKKLGYTGTEVQMFLRDLADNLTPRVLTVTDPEPAVESVVLDRAGHPWFRGEQGWFSPDTNGPLVWSALLFNGPLVLIHDAAARRVAR